MSRPTSSAPLDALWPLYPVFFVGLWILVCFIISHLGWRSFSKRHPVRNRPAGRSYASPSASFGNILGSYRNVARLVFTEEGIYFYAMFLFRVFHPPFLVPWTSVRRIEKKTGFFGGSYQLDIEDAAGEIHLVLPTKVEDDLRRFHKGT